MPERFESIMMLFRFINQEGNKSVATYPELLALSL